MNERMKDERMKEERRGISCTHIYIPLRGTSQRWCAVGSPVGAIRITYIRTAIYVYTENNDTVLPWYLYKFVLSNFSTILQIYLFSSKIRFSSPPPYTPPYSTPPLSYSSVLSFLSTHSRAICFTRSCFFALPCFCSYFKYFLNTNCIFFELNFNVTNRSNN